MGISGILRKCESLLLAGVTMSYHLVTFLQSPANANPPQGGSQLGQSHDSAPFGFDIPGDGLELFVTGVVKTQRLVTSQVHGSSQYSRVKHS